MDYLDIKNIEHDLASQIKTWAKEFGFSSIVLSSTGTLIIDLQKVKTYLNNSKLCVYAI